MKTVEDLATQMKVVQDLDTQMKGDQAPPNPIEIVSMLMQPVESTIESKQQDAYT